MIPALSQCYLRGIWSAVHNPPLLPSSPAAQLGSVVHRLLEEAGRGCFRSEESNTIESRWNELVYEVEQSMSQSFLNKRFVPLVQHLPRFDVIRIRALSRAAELACSIPGAEVRAKEATVALYGCELWVESKDGLIAGKIDRVLPTTMGPVLQDYKSGAIFTRNGDDREIRQEHTVQLHLYAALYQEATGEWPCRLELVPLTGAPQEVPYSPSDSTRLLNEARTLLDRVNQIITGLGDDWGGLEKALAMPSPSACQFCGYRPACRLYLTRDIADVDCSWPHDVWGAFADARRLGNGRLILSILLDDGSLFYVRDISDMLVEDANLLQLDESDRVGVFNARHTRSPVAFEEGWLTVIYNGRTAEK